MVAHGLVPRMFEESGNFPDEMIIYEEDQEVSEMYLVTDGIIGVGFSVM